MEKPHSHSSWLDSLKHCGSSAERPLTPTHIAHYHPLAPLFASMTAKMAALNEEHGLGGTRTFKPLILHLNGDMPEDDYISCSKLMGAFLHVITDGIIQQTNASQLPVTSTINNVELWVEAFRHFPFPVITGPKLIHHAYNNSNFTLDGDKDFIEDMIDMKGVEGLADSVIEAAKEVAQQLKSLSKQEKDFKYFGIIFGYFQQNICIRLVKFVMHMKETSVAALCDAKVPTPLNCEYYNYHFSGDADLVLQVAKRIQTAETLMVRDFIEVTLGKQARLLMTFLKHNFPLLLAYWLDKLSEFIKSKSNQMQISFREVNPESSTRPQSASTLYQKSEPNLDEFNPKEREQELRSIDQTTSIYKKFPPTLEEPDLPVIPNANMVKPTNKQRELCLTLVDEFWDQQSVDGKTLKFYYMDGNATDKQKTEDGITIRLDRQNSFTNHAGKTYVIYQLQCESNCLACVLIQIPGKGQGSVFMYDPAKVKKAFIDSLDKHEIVELNEFELELL